MKKILLMLFVFVLTKAGAQTVDDIITKYANAMGGLDSFKSVQTLKMTGIVTAQGNELPLTIQIINGKAIRTDVQAGGQMIVSAYKDGAGWKINPFQGPDAPVDLTGSELNDLKSQCYVANQLMDHQARGCTVELQGVENVDTAKAYKIKLTADDKRESFFYIDTASFMLIRSVGTRNVMGQDMEIETDYGDLKDFDGRKFSTSRIQKTNGQTFQEIHFDNILVNAPIDEKIFKKE